MVTDSLETPSQLRFFGFCLLAAAVALFAVVQFPVDAWFMFPIAVLALAALTGVDGYWRNRE